MRRLKIHEDIRPLSEFCSGVASFLKQVHDTKRPLVITQYGKGVAVLLDVAESKGERGMLKGGEKGVGYVDQGERGRVC